MLVLWLTLVLSAAAGAVLLYQGFAIVLAAEMPRLDPDPPEAVARRRASVSVVIAARNEEEDLPGTLDALLAQDYPDLEVVVVEDGSTDRTAAVIDARAPRVRRIDPPALPDGWVGKNWACWTGAHATDGEWLLFLDADVRTHPAAVRTTMDWAEREGADLATIGPRVEMKGFWERVVLPFYVQMVLTYFRAPHVNRPNSRAALANGQYWLVRRTTYEALGGHAAVAPIMLEDVAIARRFRDAGRRIRMAWAPSLASTRMYRDRHELFEGLLKNVHGARYSTLRQVGFLAGLFGFFLLPLGLLPLGLGLGNVALTALGGVLYLALFGKHVAFARAVGGSAAYGLLYPVAVAFYLVLVGTSLARGVRKQPVVWKGRNYSVRG
jgi:chlorobactene glucosyltransferase